MTAFAILAGLILWAAICTVLVLLEVPIIPGIVAVFGFGSVALAHACGVGGSSSG